MIFDRHNIVHDAPICRIDLLVCRNLLIYLETETQNLVLPRLHYALVDDGCLFLGKAETQLARSRLFRPIDMKHRPFQKVSQEWRRLPGGVVILSNAAAASFHARLMNAIVDSSSAASIVVDNDGMVVFVSAAARRMLDVGEADVGRPFQDLAISYRPTELRRFSEESASYRTHSESALGSIDLGIIVVDRNGAVVSWNRWSKNRWGLRANEVVGQPLAAIDFGLPVRLLQGAIGQALAAGEACDTTIDAVDRRSRPMRCRVRITPLSNGEGGAVLMLEDDVKDSPRPDQVDGGGLSLLPAASSNGKASQAGTYATLRNDYCRTNMVMSKG